MSNVTRIIGLELCEDLLKPVNTLLIHYNNRPLPKSAVRISAYHASKIEEVLQIMRDKPLYHHAEEETYSFKDHVADNVDHPEHYQSDSGIECIDAIRAALGLDAFVAHCRATAIKYAWRSGKKAKHAEDLRKGAWYLNRAAEELER